MWSTTGCSLAKKRRRVGEMKVLVTGGAGFIASHIVDAYVERGHAVTVVDNLSSGQRENVNRRAELIVADLRDPKTANMLHDRHSTSSVITRHRSMSGSRSRIQLPTRI